MNYKRGTEKKFTPDQIKYPLKQRHLGVDAFRALISSCPTGSSLVSAAPVNMRKDFSPVQKTLRSLFVIYINARVYILP